MDGLQASGGEEVAWERSILALLGDLVGVPSRAASDDPANALAVVRAWMVERGLPCEDLLDEEGRLVGLTGLSGPGLGRPNYFLNATIDTAGFGNPASWRASPSSALIEDGRLYGRGSADSKAGVAIFCHVFARFHGRSADLPCGLGYIFDAEEHSGKFTGMRRFLDSCDSPPAGVIIGYPGFDRIVTGARGFYRATVRLHGEPGHSGSSSGRGVNAVEKASALIQRLSSAARELGTSAEERFPLPPKLTVTRVEGGGEFSLVPDLCDVDVDIRLTPAFKAADAQALVGAAAAEVDAASPARIDAEILFRQSYPAYLLADDSQLVRVMREATRQVLGRSLPTGPCGPSNVGNLLAAAGIEALCGFGVRAEGIHGIDEWVDTSTLVPVCEVYCAAVAQLLGRPVGEGRWQARTWEGKSFA